MVIQHVRQFLRKRSIIFFYALYVAIVYFFIGYYGWRSATTLRGGIQLFLYASAYLVGFWINKRFLFPGFFLKGRLSYYFLYTCLSFFALHFLQTIVQMDSFHDFPHFFEEGSAFFLLVDVLVSQITFFMFCGLGISISLTDTWLKNMNEIAGLKNEKLKAELISLKNQLSPHFLFNTLNMVHILTKTNPAVASDVTLELAELMRYQLYGSSREVVKLEEEVAFIQNLLKIEKLRKDDKLMLSFRMDVQFPGASIQPLVLAPLVENALKHGSQKMERAEIGIVVENCENKLSFEIWNNYNRKESRKKDEGTGTGLLNLKRRLELGYGNKFSLSTWERGGMFIAKLIIKYS